MNYGIIATWLMSRYAIEEGATELKKEHDAGDVIEKAIRSIEDYPYYKSVGYGGLPNEHGVVELDGAFMDGKTLSIGGVAGAKQIKNPISVARALSSYRFNNLLVGEGADCFALENGFETTNLLSDRAKLHYQKRLKEIKEKNLNAYSGHDTVGMVALDTKGHMVVGTSTSGLFMKKAGRVGDSPIVGSGFYCDEEVGGCVATGVGEDIMKGCLSYEVVRRLKDGQHPMEACKEALDIFEKELFQKSGNVRAISIVCLNKYGEYGVATNVDFTFVVANKNLAPTVYFVDILDNAMNIRKSTNQDLDNYYKKIKAPIE